MLTHTRWWAKGVLDISVSPPFNSPSQPQSDTWLRNAVGRLKAWPHAKYTLVLLFVAFPSVSTAGLSSLLAERKTPIESKWGRKSTCLPRILNSQELVRRVDHYLQDQGLSLLPAVLLLHLNVSSARCRQACCHLISRPDDKTRLPAHTRWELTGSSHSQIAIQLSDVKGDPLLH